MCVEGVVQALRYIRRKAGVCREGVVSKCDDICFDDNVLHKNPL